MSEVLLTGATSGLGRWLAPELGAAGLTVLLHGRDPRKVERGVAEVEAADGKAEGFVADLADLADVDRLAAAVGGRPLTVLVNNAGVGFGARDGGRELSADGYELRWAVNLLAPVRLTEALLPTLRANAPARIVNVGSLGQRPIDFDDLQLERHYNGVDAYRRAKLALAAWTFDLAAGLAGTGVTANCIHPATFMDTGMVRQYGQRPFTTVEQGGRATLRLILEEPGTGLFFDGEHPAEPHPDARDPAVRARLRDALRPA
ncbi:SDR family NAD(P)-dependent oxidoreductase [Dactylosporangium sp. CA-139066]|uniref:SDR family NAD(P)-dependent oxidoreductase n=1 Tax=Dactylosporangium sp. CA-139066 TaxID=3239930 RepID=UPI003D9032FE